MIPAMSSFAGTGDATAFEPITEDEINYIPANGYPPLMYINSPDDFVTFGWTGDGSSGSPYTLDGQSYTHYEGIGYIIEIEDTRVNFTIQNCDFTGSPSYDTIYLHNVTNGLITGCSFTTGYAAISLWNTTGIVIENNTMQSYNRGGYIRSSPSVTFSHNTVGPFTLYGVTNDVNSPYAVIYDNEIANGTNSNGAAIYVQGSSSNVTYNTIYSCVGVGIFAYQNNFSKISYNNIRNMTEEGIFNWESSNTTINFNEIHCVDRDGIFIWFSEGLSISNNTIYLANMNGIHIRVVTETEITHNEIFACSDYGILIIISSQYNNVTYNSIGWNSVNAADECSNNIWDSNSWSDKVSSSYSISGSAGSIDSNPEIFVDSSAPIISDESNLLYFESATGNYINWTFDDDHPRLWALEIDEVEVDSGKWCGDYFYLDIDGLSIGEYNYTLIVEDAAGTNSSDEVIVTVDPYDYDAPIIEGFNDQILEAGTESISLHWNATDLHPEKYVLYRNGTPIEDGAYVSGVNTTYDVVAMGVSSYNYTCWFNDTLGNNDTHTVWVYFVDTSNPVSDSPDDITYAVGATGNNITWTCSDLYSESYSIYINGTLNKTDIWDGNKIVFIVDGFDIGRYNITIVAVDESGNTVTDTVFVTVEAEATTTTTTTTTTDTDTTTSGTTTGTTETDTLSILDEGTMMIISLILGFGGVVFVIVIVVFLKSKK